MKIAPSILKINSVTVDAIDGAAIEIKVERGIDPSSFAFTVSEDGPADRKLRKLRNPVSVTVEAAAGEVSRPTRFTLRNWHVVARTPDEKGWVVYEVADVRWAQNREKLTAEYNIVSYGGKYRKRSLNKGLPWKAYDAANDALAKLGYSVEIDPDIDPSVKLFDLPDNLGPPGSVAGGFAATAQAVAMPLLLNACHCDPVPTQAGGMMLVDRFSKRSKGLRSIRVGGALGVQDIHWQEPGEIVVPLERRIERMAEYVERGTAATDRLAMQLDNVIPYYNPSDTGRNLKFHTELITFIDQAATDGRFIQFAKALRYMLRKTMVDEDNPNYTPEQIDIMRGLEDLFRTCLRLRFRFRSLDSDSNPAASLDDLRQNYCDVELGRLQADGTTKRDAVFMDHVRMLRYGRREKPRDHPLLAKFSENVPLINAKPSPFTADWLDRENLIFQLQGPDTANLPHGIRGYMPGLLNNPICYGDTLFGIIRRREKLRLETNAELRTTFRLNIYWHGLWIGTKPLERLLKIKQPGIGSGEGGTVTTRLAEGITANFDADLRWINEPECRTKAKEIADDVRDSFRREEAGMPRFGGVDVLAKDKAWVGGDIHALSIFINRKGRGSVETDIVVLPGRRPRAPRVLTGPRPAGAQSRRVL